MDNGKGIEEIVTKLDSVIRLLALDIIMRMDAESCTKTDQIARLGAAGIDRNTIADIVGTTPETVSVTLSQLKSERSKASRRKQNRKAEDGDTNQQGSL